MTDILFVLVTLHPPSSYFVSKIIYMSKVFSITANSPVWVIIPSNIHSTQKTNFSNCKREFLWQKHFTFCYEIIPNFRYTVIPGKYQKLNPYSYELWSHFAFTSLNYFFGTSASSSPPIRSKTNSVPTNIPLNVIPIMLKSFFMGVFFKTEFKFFSS